MLIGDSTGYFNYASKGISDSCSLGDRVAIAVDTGANSRLLVFDMTVPSLLYDISLGGETVSGITFLTSNTVACLNYNGGVGNVRHVVLNTSTVTTIANDFSVRPQKSNQAAGDSANTRAMYVAYTTVGTGKLGTVTDVPAVGLVTVSALSGAKGVCIKHRPGTSNFIVGGDNGKVIEVDFTGAVISSVTLPTTPNSGTVPSRQVANVAVSEDGNDVFVSTQEGTVFHYDWTGPTLLTTTTMATSGTVTQNMIMSDFCNNLVIRAVEGVSTSQPTISLMHGATELTTDVAVVGKTATIVNVHLTTSGYGAVVTTTKLLIFKVLGLASSNVTTRAQYPAGVDAAQRIIRLAKSNDGRFILDNDSSQASGSQTVSATFTDCEYYELSLIGTPGVNEVDDVRNFKV